MLKALFITILLASIPSFAAPPVPLTKTFAYQGKNYRTSMEPSGILNRGLFGKTQVFNSLSVVGNYIDEAEKYDTRLFQHAARQVSATMEQLGNNRIRIVSSGTVGNAKYPEAASYRQITLFEPDRIKIDYQFTSKIPMATRMDIFRNIMNLPLTAVIDRGIATSGKEKTDQFISVPALCEKGKGINKGGILILKISYPEGIFQATAGTDTSFSVMDCRSWGENNFRLDAAPASVWKQVPEVHPVGKRWTWSITFRFQKHDD